MKIELRGDIWGSLFPHPFTPMEEVRKHGGIEPFWTFGGGTVLMLRYPLAFYVSASLLHSFRLGERAPGCTSIRAMGLGRPRQSAD